jgi:glycosyltransferase involved in cell wall biosynthesis
MRILIAHNAYQQRGGEDAVVEAEIDLLNTYGHEVVTYFRSNDDITAISGASVAIQTLWSSRTKDEMAKLMRAFQPDVIHVHNTLPLISPSIYWAAARAGVPVVQTLHNFRLMCLNALYLREGKVCEDCAGCLPWRGILRKCYRNSGTASSVLASMLILHRALGTYDHKVDRFIALTQFAKNKCVEANYPANKLTVKPNFYSGVRTADDQTEGCTRHGALFVGRISQEKGISTLIRSWTEIDCDLRLAGDGSLTGEVDSAGNQRIKRLGSLPSVEVSAAMSESEFLVMPSVWYEGFPMVLVEAFAHGLPVVASRLGSMAEIVEDGVTGLLFETGNAEDLAVKVRWMIEHPDECRQMGYNARHEFEQKYTPERNYEMLMKIYQEAIDEKT